MNDDLFTDTVRIRDFDTAMRQALLDAGQFDWTGGLSEGRHALSAAPVGQWIAPRAGELAVGARLLARLGERDQRDAAEAEFAAAAAEPLDPASRPGGLDEKVQAVAVTMPAAGRVYQQNHLHENERAILRYSKRAHV